MSRALDQLLAILDIEKLEVNLFRGVSPQVGWQRVFGGQVIGQALVAAYRTVNGRTAHSLHGYFLRPGDPAVPILYNVDRIRDGGSFSTRRVVAIQHGQAIFSMAASFHKHEEGLSHQVKMPEVPAAGIPAKRGRAERAAARSPAAAGQDLLGARAADRDQARRPFPLSQPGKARRHAASVDQGDGEPRRRPRSEPMRACLCLRFHPARYRADRPWPLHLRSVADARKPRSFHLVSSAFPGR